MCIVKKILLGIVLSVILLLPSYAVLVTEVEQKLNSENLKAARHALAWKKRRVIMNNDGNDAYHPNKPTWESFLDSRTASLAGSQVDAIFYCDGIWGSFTHKSSTSDLLAIANGGRKVLSVEIMEKEGSDPLKKIVDFGHKNNMEVFWSLRMNDTHDSGDAFLLSDWKKANPDCLVGKREERQLYTGAGKRWSGVNYAKKIVRDRTVGWFDEVATNYDVDGFELDFFRHLVFFKNPLHGKPATEENLQQMTDVVRRIRKIADQHALRRGKPILISIRVPDSLGYCKDAGLDVEQWLKEGLVDMMTVSGYFRLNPWKASVELGHRYDVPVYAGLSESRFKPSQRKSINSVENYYGRAMTAWQEGVDGIYTFNLFDPHSPVFRKVGDPVSLSTMSKNYTTGARSVTHYGNSFIKGGLKYLNRPYPLPDRPEKLSVDKPVTVTIDVWDDLTDPNSKMQADVELFLTGLEDASKLTVTLNGQKLKQGTFDADGQLVCSIPSCHLKVGENRFRFKLVSPVSGKVVLRDLIVSVKHH